MEKRKMVNPTIGMLIKYKADVTVTLIDDRKFHGVLLQASPGFVILLEDSDNAFMLPMAMMKGIKIDKKEVDRLKEV